jgi:GeoRSP system radical SAM/SPASM protein
MTLGKQKIYSAPLLVNWSLNYSCNFSCEHCYSRLEKSEELDTAQALEAGRRLAKAGVLFANFGGGEPLLRKDLFPLAKELAGVGLSLSMNSNGWLLDAAAAAALKEAGFASVGLSLDSHRPEVHDRFRNRPGSFDRVAAAAGHLVRAGLKLTLSTVICRINHKDLPPLLAYGRQLGASQMFLHNFKCSGKGMEHRFELDLEPMEWRDFYREALAFSKDPAYPEICFDDPILASLGARSAESGVAGSTCGKLSLHLRPNGDITPCGFIPLVLGNILRDDLPALWRQSQVLDALRHKHATGKCTSCGHYAACLGGCTARAYAVTGDFNAPDPHCWENTPG